MSIDIHLLGPSDAATLDRVRHDVFDEPIDPRWRDEFLADARHHLVVALDDGWVVGMCTAVDYVHPDKPRQLWINEIGVATSHRRCGIGKRLLDAMLAHGRTLGCTEAWLGTEETNAAANALYRSAGSTREPFVLHAFDLNER